MATGCCRTFGVATGSYAEGSRGLEKPGRQKSCPFWLWKSNPSNRRLRIGVLLGLQFLPVLATESYFRPDETRFMRSFERGEVQENGFGPYAWQSRRPPFGDFSLNWDEEMGFWVLK
jgi:hypothetical protein